MAWYGLTVETDAPLPVELQHCSGVGFGNYWLQMLSVRLPNWL